MILKFPLQYMKSMKRLASRVVVPLALKLLEKAEVKLVRFGLKKKRIS